LCAFYALWVNPIYTLQGIDLKKVSRMDKRSASIKINHRKMMDALRLSILHLFIRFCFD
jgi:hypothetical protein